MNAWYVPTAEEWGIIALSLKVASVATLASLPAGVLVALALARGQFPGKNLLDGVVHLPLVLPPVVTGYALLLLLGRKGVLGSGLYEVFGISFSFRWTGAALACAVMGFPLLVRAVRLAIEMVDPQLERAAGTLGASAFWVFITITLPLAFRGIIAGFVLSFAKALGEFGATITFVSNIPGETRTIPVAIYTYTQIPEGDLSALRLSVISVVISLGTLLIAELLARKSARRGFVAS